MTPEAVGAATDPVATRPADTPQERPRRLSHQEYLASHRFAQLDGLRAVSILLVFTAHPASHEFWPHFHGQAGVTIFFVLSGFLITTLLLREESRTSRVSFRAFYVRRLFRIYPMFLLVFALYCVLLLGLGLQPERRAAFVANIPYFLLFFPEHAIFFNTTGVEVPFNMTWSIGVEEKFYLIWPLLGFGLLARSRPLRIATLLLVFGVGLVGGLTPSGTGRALAPYAHIALGGLVAVLLNSSRHYRWMRVLGHRVVLAILIVGAVLMQLGTVQVVNGGRLYVAYGFVVAAVLAGLVTSRHSEHRWLTSRPMVYIGSLSYVLYLIHNFGLNFAEMVIPHSSTVPWTFLSTALGLGGAFVAAHVLHTWFEEPLRRFGVKLSKRYQVAPRGEGELGAARVPNQPATRAQRN